MSIKKVLLLLGLLLVWTVNAGAAEKEETVNFKYCLETGKQFGYQLTVKTAATQSVLGVAVKRNEEWQIQYRFTVLSGSGNRGGALLRATYKAINYRLDSPFQQYDYRLDPDDATLPERLKPYAKLIGTEFKISLQKAPKIEVNTKKDHPEKPEEFDLQQFFANFSSDALAAQYEFPKLINNIFWVLPNGTQKFKVNDSWQAISSLTNGQFEPNVKTECRITEINAGQIKIVLGTPEGCKYQKEQPLKEEQVELTKLVANLAGSLTGQVEFEKESKLPLVGAIDLNMDGIIQRFGANIPVNYKMVIQYQRI